MSTKTEKAYKLTQKFKRKRNVAFSHIHLRKRTKTRADLLNAKGTKDGMRYYRHVQELINALMFVPNLPGTVYMGEGAYLVDLKVLAEVLFPDLHTMHKHCKISAGLRFCLAAGQLADLVYDPTASTVVIKLRPIIDNFDDYKIPTDCNPVDMVFKAMHLIRRAIPKTSAAYEELLRKVSIEINTTCFHGFECPNDWRFAEALAEEYKKHGSAALYCGPDPFDNSKAELAAFKRRSKSHIDKVTQRGAT